MTIYQISTKLLKEVEFGNFTTLKNKIIKKKADTLRVFKQEISIQLAKNLSSCLQETPSIKTVKIRFRPLNREVQFNLG